MSVPGDCKVEHVVCPDEEFWTCGDIVLHEESERGQRCLSLRGANRLYLSHIELVQLIDILDARSDPKEAATAGWLIETKAAS